MATTTTSGSGGGSGGAFATEFGKILTYFCVGLLAATNAFNVDLENVVEYHGQSQTMFGFSVAEHKEQGKSWVVIGAPEMPDMTARSDYRGGAVFYCDTERSDSCHMIPASNYKHAAQHNMNDNDTVQWLGATVRSSGENGVILTCAPRYYWFRGNGNSLSNRDPVGTCFISKSHFNNFEEYSPCRNKNYGHGKQGSCQVGFGAALTKGSDRVYLGAVGSYYWQGQIVSILHTHLKLPYIFEDHELKYDPETGQAFSQSVYNKPDFLVTKEGPKSSDDSYMGYSVASIEYSGFRSKMAGVVTGIPRADHMLGKVSLMTWNLTDLRNITGEQFASYFGYSLCVADVDGDGADDIIVGAPMFSDYNPNKMDYERGRVYVFYQTTRPCDIADKVCWSYKFTKIDFLDGEQSKSRFGLSLASLGDINQDGYEDFAVGAPYEGLQGGCTRTAITGAVYIYHGSRNGVRKKHSQVIRAGEMSHRDYGLTTFGFSLSGGLDLDNNTYPDLVIGAYESDTVYLFKSRPVIQLEANLTFQSESKMIGLNDNNCLLRNNVLVSCVPLQLCLKYDGVGADDQITLRIQIMLDAKQPLAPRMFFIDYEGNNLFKDEIPLVKGGTRCRTLKTYIARLRPTQDRLTPLEAELKYQLKEQFYTRKGVLNPVLNMDDETPLTRRDNMNIKNNCGSDNICKPNLQMAIMSNVKQYVLGSGDLIFNMTVQNFEEDSFGTVFKMRVPPGVSYSRFEDLTYPRTDLSIQCYPPRKENNYTINCDIGNPLPAAGKVKFSIILEPSPAVEEPQFDFWVNVTTSNPQVSTRMQSQEMALTMPILEETSLQINGISSQTEIYYNTSQYDHNKIESDIEAGPFIRHEYTIKNLGPSEILEADVVFDWPSQLSTGEDLLYLISQPKTVGNIKCERVPNVNYLHLQIRRRFNDDYTEYDTTSSTSTGAQSAGKYNQNIGGSSINQIHQGSHKQQEVHYGSGGSSSTTAHVNQQGGSYYEHNHKQTTNQNTYQQGGSKGTYQGSGVIYQQGGSHSTSQGSGSVYQQGGQGGTYQGSGGVYHQGSTHQQGGTFQEGHIHQTNTQEGTYQQGQQHSSSGGHWTSNSNGNNQGIYQGGHQGGYEGQGHYMGGGSYEGANKNFNSIHESESKYTKNTVNNNGNANTYIEGQWRTNDNGVVKNGSFSTIRPGPGYDYNLNRDPPTFFENQPVPTYVGEKNSHHQGYGADQLNTAGRGTIIHRQQVGDDILTTIDEGVYRSPPEVNRRGNETEDVYHYKGESVKFGKPTKLPDNYVVPKQWKLPGQNVPYRDNEEEKLPLQHSSQDDEASDDDDDGMETGEGDEEDDVNYNNDDEPKKHTRSKRAVKSESGQDFCTMSSCTKVICTIGHMAKNDEVSVIFPAIVWARTIRKIALNRPVEIGSYVEVNITKLPHIKTPRVNVTYAAEILTNVKSTDYSKNQPGVIPLWIVVTSACLGTLILMLLVFLLYKSGFFKRNRPPHIPERQPLNRNGGGYHMGDEAL